MNYRKDNVAFSASTVLGNLFAVSGELLGISLVPESVCSASGFPDSLGRTHLMTCSPSGQSLSLHEVVSARHLQDSVRSASGVLVICFSQQAHDPSLASLPF